MLEISLGILLDQKFFSLNMLHLYAGKFKPFINQSCLCFSGPGSRKNKNHNDTQSEQFSHSTLLSRISHKVKIHCSVPLRQIHQSREDNGDPGCLLNICG